VFAAVVTLGHSSFFISIVVYRSGSITIYARYKCAAGNVCGDIDDLTFATKRKDRAQPNALKIVFTGLDDVQ
jgi:hypothetical protein